MAFMVVAGVFAQLSRPTILMASQRDKVDLELMVPKQFGNWRELEQSSGQVINPQTSPLLQKLYTETLSRTYVSKDGKIIMLSIAYGANQSRGVALHYPEICYPAQGFQLISAEPTLLETHFGSISAKHLMTRLGSRNEPVTYWTTLGDNVVTSGIQTKLAQINYGFQGLIPDGLIFRVSSIDMDANKGHVEQAIFVNELMSALPSTSRQRLAALGR